MIFLTISNSIPHVNGVSGSERTPSIALEILFSVTRFFLKLAFKLKTHLALRPWNSTNEGHENRNVSFVFAGSLSKRRWIASTTRNGIFSRIFHDTPSWKGLHRCSVSSLLRTHVVCTRASRVRACGLSLYVCGRAK